LIEELAGYQKAMLIDSLVTRDYPCGTCLEFRLEELEQYNYERFVAAHGFNISTLWKLAAKLGIRLPDEFRIIGIVIDEQYRFGEKLSPGLEAAFEGIVDTIGKIIAGWVKMPGKESKGWMLR
jgi:hydrogenase maturation protease